MTAQEKDRIECAIRHIHTAVDVDPWAKEIAVDAMKTQLSAEGTTSDLISRQAAIDAAIKADMENNSNVLSEKRARVIDRHISAVPSAQPEIVRCKDCKHRDPEDKKCDCGHAILWQLPRQDDWYCADAERRTDEGD